MIVRYVKAHDEQVGNEREDKLVKMGAELRRKLLKREWGGDMVIGEAMGDYWSNRSSKSS